MKLLDKLKNALFEEEYVEVEEKEERKKEKPIAKKIIIEDSKPKKEETLVEEKTSEKDFKFKAILEDDFIDLNPKEETIEEQKEEIIEIPEEIEKPIYQKEKKTKVVTLYGEDKENEIKVQEYGTYEKKQEKKEFRPSPIISPIYGILDQNYKKDEIVTKKEVRISSSYKPKNVDVDSVRAKAYGNNDDIFDEELTSNKKVVESELEDFDIKEDNFLDISEDNTPSVSKVTMGDAEEYFEDLGLEYNIDYKDVAQEKRTGRRTDLRAIEEEEIEEDNYEEETNLEDNLFDLIDSMYDEKKGE